MQNCAEVFEFCLLNFESSGLLAQLAEQPPLKRKRVGSSPTQPMSVISYWSLVIREDNHKTCLR